MTTLATAVTFDWLIQASDLFVKSLEQKHRYGCLLGIVPDPLRKQITDWVIENIHDVHLFSPDSRELRPHVTCLYGFRDSSAETLEAVKALLVRRGPIRFRLGTALTTFPANKDGVPLKVDIDSPDLQALNAILRQSFDVEVKYPEYRPHLTLAYLTEAAEGLYSEEQPPFLGQEVLLHEVEYSTPEKDRITIPLSFLPIFQASKAWITIGGVEAEHDGRHERHHGGAPVEIDESGKIRKGPAKLVNRNVADLPKKKPGPAADTKPKESSPDRKPETPKPEDTPKFEDPKPFGNQETSKPKEPQEEKPEPYANDQSKEPSNAESIDAGTRGEPARSGETSQDVAPEAERSGDTTTSERGQDADKPTDTKPTGDVPRGRVPADLGQVNKRLDRYEQAFRKKGQEKQADWMKLLRQHINEVGTEVALKELGEEQASTERDRVVYEGEKAGWESMDAFTHAYLNRHGIVPVHSTTDKADISSLSQKFTQGGPEDGYTTGDLFTPRDPELPNKLEEAKRLPGLESSEDIGVIMGKEVTHLTDDVTAKMDERYGKGQWIIKVYGDDAYAGFGIFFPQRIQALKKEAQDAIWSSGSELARYGFSHLRDKDSGAIIGIQHQSGDKYEFGSKEYESRIYGAVRKAADRAEAAAKNEKGPALLDRNGNLSGKEFMAQPAFAAVGISDEERARGITGAEGGKGEGRVHIVTRNGKAEIVPHSTWIKGAWLPVVFESEETKQMAQAAVDAINALPESERQGQIYAPDVMRSTEGYRVIEANPANNTGSSGYLGDNPFIIDSYVSHIMGEEPLHTKFIRDLLSKRKSKVKESPFKDRKAMDVTLTKGGVVGMKARKPKASQSDILRWKAQRHDWVIHVQGRSDAPTGYLTSFNTTFAIIGGVSNSPTTAKKYDVPGANEVYARLLAGGWPRDTIKIEYVGPPHPDEKSFHGLSATKDFDPEQLAEGQRVEMEHTDDPAEAERIAMDHLAEHPQYYSRLRLVESGYRLCPPQAKPSPFRNRKSLLSYRTKAMSYLNSASGGALVPPSQVGDKPANCTCNYPAERMRNGSGHRPDCPCHREWEERGGFNRDKQFKALTKADPIKVHLPDLKQHEDFTCGAAAMEAICEYFGVGPETEDDFVALLQSDPEEGTPPARILALAQRLGLKVEAANHRDLDWLRAQLDREWPVLVLIQAWGEEAAEAENYPNYDDGHYVIAVGYDQDKIYFEDPSLKGNRGYLNNTDFEARWHDEARGEQYEHWGAVFAKPHTYEEIKGVVLSRYPRKILSLPLMKSSPFTYRTKEQGQPCKQGEAASRTGCIPASGEATGKQKQPKEGTQGTQRRTEQAKRTSLPPLKEVPELPQPKSAEAMKEWLPQALNHPYIQEAERLLASAISENTKDKYSKEGVWDATRVEEVHNPIIAKFLNPKAKPPEGVRPKAVMLIGPFGAGKSTFGEPVVKKMMPEYTLVNPDEVKGMMPEDEGWNATVIHEESSHISREVQKAATDAGHNILFDGSGQNEEKMNRMADEYTKRGYDVHVVHVTVPTHISTYRAAKRYLANPLGAADPNKRPTRYAPLEYVQNEVDGKPDNTYKRLKDNPNVKSGISYNTDVQMGEQAIELDKFDR